MQRTVDIIQRISQKYSDPSYFGVVTSLAMLNEPATYLNNDLLQTTRQYWYDAYGSARYPWAKDGRADKSGLALIISDGFQPLSSFEGYMTAPDYEDVGPPVLDRYEREEGADGQVLIDTHNYQVFDGFYNAWSYDEHLQVSYMKPVIPPTPDYI